jgi:uncharacterized protein YfkK (UPF0435 family)
MNDNNFCKTCCNHLFHVNCLGKHIYLKNNNCPLCRKSLFEENYTTFEEEEEAEAEYDETTNTLDNNLPGPDQWFSENPEGLKQWCENIKKSYSMLGNSLLKPTNIEKENRNEFRRFIVAIKHIQKNEVFSRKNMGMRRTSDKKSLSPIFFEFLLGRKSIKNYSKGESI